MLKFKSSFCLAVTFGELWKFEQYDTMCLQEAMKALQVVKIQILLYHPDNLRM